METVGLVVIETRHFFPPCLEALQQNTVKRNECKGEEKLQME